MNTLFKSCLIASASMIAMATAGAQTAGPRAPAERGGAAAVPQKPVPAETALDTITVTGTKTEGAAVDALSGSSIVTREDIERVQAQRISQALRNVPGVNVQENPNSPEQAINIRGLQNFGRVNILVDGARQDYQTTGHSAGGTFYLDPAFIGRVDITRGPASTVYGSGAIGGVAAFTTRTVDDILNPGQTFGVEQKIGLGTNGAGFENASAMAVRVSPNVELFGQFVYRNSSTYKDGQGNKVPDSGSDLTGGLFKAKFRPADGHEITASALAQHYNFTNNGTSSAVTATRFNHDVTAQTYTLGYRFARPDIPLIDLTINTYYTATTDEQRIVLPSPSYASLGARIGSPLTYDIGTLGFDIHNTSRFATGPVDHALTFGIDGVRDEVRTTDLAGGYGAAFTPSGNRRLFGGFLQDELRFGGFLRVLGALRYDSFDLKGGATHNDGQRVSPKFTVGVTPFSGVELYATYAEGYRSPALSEALIDAVHPYPPFRILPNPNLKPETAHNLEAGINVKYDDVLRAGDVLRGKFAVFTNRVDNYIEQVELPGTIPFIPCGVPRFCTIYLPNVQYQNISQARLNGVEGEAIYDWGGGYVQLAGAVISGKNKANGETLVSVPPNKIGGTLAFRFFDDRLTMGVRGTAYDEKKLPAGFTAALPGKPYGIVDVFASYKVNDKVRGDLVLENVFDKRYRPYLNGSYNPGFTAKFALTVKFAS